MAQMIAIAVTLAVLAAIVTRTIVKERRRKSLVKDDGFVWNTTIEKRLEEESR